MKGLNLIIFIVIFAIFIHDIKCWIKCDETSYCNDGNICCITIHNYFRCCSDRTRCCDGGLKCCYDSSFDTNSISISESSIATTPQEKPDDYSLVIDSFLKKIKFYDALPETTECGKKIQFLFPQFIEVFLELKEASSIDMIIQIVIQAYQDLSFEVMKVILECQDVSQEVKKKIHDISQRLEDRGNAANMVMNAIMQSSDIYDSITIAFDNFNDGDYKACGEELGSLFNIIFILDIEDH